MLDSSTVASPHVRKSLKRSASTASLPTPPRTYRKHLRGKSKGSCDSEDLASSSDLEGVSEPNKKRRLDSGDEDAFWLNGRSEPAGSNSKTSGATMSKLQTAPWLYRKRNGQTSQVDSAPVSPPPSYRKTKTRFRTPKISSTSEGKSPPVTSPPSTPRRYMTRSTFRDSPDNPFLATPVKDESSPPSDSADPSPSTPSYDKPYITYVFRGTRRTYQNPHYDHAQGRPLSPPPASELPIEHPDYSPSLICPPKRLFPRITRQSKQPRLNSPSGDEDGEVVDLRPKKLNFGITKHTRGAGAKSAPGTFSP